MDANDGDSAASSERAGSPLGESPAVKESVTDLLSAQGVGAGQDDDALVLESGRETESNRLRTNSPAPNAAETSVKGDDGSKDTAGDNSKDRSKETAAPKAEFHRYPLYSPDSGTEWDRSLGLGCSNVVAFAFIPAAFPWRSASRFQRWSTEFWGGFRA